jgi:hypothetical protein
LKCTISQCEAPQHQETSTIQEPLRNEDDSITARQESYHNAKIDGEAQETLNFPGGLLAPGVGRWPNEIAVDNGACFV